MFYNITCYVPGNMPSQPFVFNASNPHKSAEKCYLSPFYRRGNKVKEKYLTKVM